MSDDEMVEVIVGGQWQVGRLVSRGGDGWCRVSVDCFGKVRELTFAPQAVRSPSVPIEEDQ